MKASRPGHLFSGSPLALVSCSPSPMGNGAGGGRGAGIPFNNNNNNNNIYIYLHVLGNIYICRPCSHPTSRGAATAVGRLKSIVSFALKTGLKGAKPRRLRMFLRSMWIRHSLAIFSFFMNQNDKNVAIVNCQTQTPACSSRNCTATLCCGKNFADSCSIASWLPMPLQHSVLFSAAHQTVVMRNKSSLCIQSTRQWSDWYHKHCMHALAPTT